jgi:uncharacterized protein
MEATPTGNVSLTILAIILIIMVVVLHYFINGKKFLRGLLMRITVNSFSPQSADFIIEKFTGFLLFGPVLCIIFLMIPGIAPKNIGITMGRTLHYWYLILSMIVVAGLLSFIASGKGKDLKISPHLGIKEWHFRHIFLSASGWSLYLFGYEFMLRGLLWFLCLATFGLWPAIIINVLIYSLIHIPKGIVMTTGSIPVGILFCLITNLTGSFFSAFLIHVTMSVSNDIFSVIRNPEFRLITGRKNIDK